MILRNKIISAGRLGPEPHYVLASKPTDNPKVRIYLMNAMNSESDNPMETKRKYSLWNVEYVDENRVIMSLYKGEDSLELEIELGEKFIEHAFQDNNDEEEQWQEEAKKYIAKEKEAEENK